MVLLQRVGACLLAFTGLSLLLWSSVLALGIFVTVFAVVWLATTFFNNPTGYRHIRDCSVDVDDSVICAGDGGGEG
ncbi:hypothetical protein [Motilimonas pumila]|uniref:Uncharacterized protein n=1 Tax=Motilimonas pumila TaxID=2303987 RepID=A0A418YK83_9GAMM|nr:hypothetical protein [Motilimonas pumila]RJG51240.1 hypothetical protein D1Z90_00455 [Motilimonas pumila]